MPRDLGRLRAARLALQRAASGYAALAAAVGMDGVGTRDAADRTKKRANGAAANLYRAARVYAKALER